MIAPLLGKLYISPASSEAKIREAFAAVSEAIEGGLLTDASSRNALYKIHVSLGKIVHSLDAAAAAGDAERDRGGFGASMRRSVMGGGGSSSSSRRGSWMGGDERPGTAAEDRSTIMLAPSEAKIKEEDEEEDGQEKEEDGQGEEKEEDGQDEEDDATVVGIGQRARRASFADESMG